MKTLIPFTAILSGAFVVAIVQIKPSPSKDKAPAEPLTASANGASPEFERPSTLGGTVRGPALSAEQALMAIERLLSEPNHSETEKAIEKAILSALRGMKKSDRGPFLRDASNLIAQSDLPDRNRVLESLTQKWAENDVDGLTEWAASTEEEITGMTLPAIGMAMANWSPEQAAAWFERQVASEPQSHTAHSANGITENTAATGTHIENVSQPMGNVDIDKVLPPSMAMQVKAAGAWDSALSEE